MLTHRVWFSLLQATSPLRLSTWPPPCSPRSSLTTPPPVSILSRGGNLQLSATCRAHVSSGRLCPGSPEYLFSHPCHTAPLLCVQP